MFGPVTAAATASAAPAVLGFEPASLTARPPADTGVATPKPTVSRTAMPASRSARRGLHALLVVVVSMVVSSPEPEHDALCRAAGLDAVEDKELAAPIGVAV